MDLESKHNDVEPDLIQDSLHALFRQEMTAALACSVGGDNVTIWTAYIAMGTSSLFFTSQETADHSAAIRAADKCAAAIWRRPSEWGGALHGLQLYGSCSEVTNEVRARAGLEALHDRFPGTAATVPDEGAVLGDSRKTCLFEFIVRSGKIIDEQRLGARRFVDLALRDASE